MPAGCGGAEERVAERSTPIRESLAGVQRRAETLDAKRLAADGLLPREPLELLAETRFRRAALVEYSGRTAIHNHVVFQRLAFAQGTGAATYLRWLERHVTDLIPRIEATRSLPLGVSGTLYRA